MGNAEGKIHGRKETFITLSPEYQEESRLADLLNNWSKAPKQMELLMAYLHLSKTEGEVKQAELLKKSGASAAQLKGLVDKGIVRAQKLAVDRIRYLAKEVNIDFQLSEGQISALHQIAGNIRGKERLSPSWDYLQW